MAFSFLDEGSKQELQDNLTNSINGAFDGSLELASLQNPNALRNDGSNLLKKMGFDLSDPNAKKAQNSAENVVSSILSGQITPDNLEMLTDYNGNNVLKNFDTPLGQVANNVNDLLDNAATSKLNAKPETSSANSKEASTVTVPDYYPEILSRYRPKYKYLFVVEIILKQEYQDIPTSCTFLITNFKKPDVSIEYEEINFYNFRSMVPKKTIYSPCSFDLHNDIGNYTMNFIVAYLRRISPIFNQTNSSIFESSGMDFKNATSSYGLNTQPINESDMLNTHIIDTITVYDYYNANNTMDTYRFYNPKISKITMDEFDMSNNDGSKISLEFVYDSVNIETGIKASVIGNDVGAIDLPVGDGIVLAHPSTLMTPDLTELYVTLNEQSKNNKDPAENYEEPTDQEVPGNESEIPMNPDDVSNLNKDGSLDQNKMDSEVNKNNVSQQNPIEVDQFNESLNKARPTDYTDAKALKDKIENDYANGNPAKLKPSEKDAFVSVIDQAMNPNNPIMLKDDIDREISKMQGAEKYMEQYSDSKPSVVTVYR